MVAELNILTEWIPEQMEPGTIFILENAGEVGTLEDPYWAVLSCPECGTLGLITRRQIGGFAPRSVILSWYTACGVLVVALRMAFRSSSGGTVHRGPHQND